MPRMTAKVEFGLLPSEKQDNIVRYAQKRAAGMCGRGLTFDEAQAFVRKLLVGKESVVKALAIPPLEFCNKLPR
jgi:hypothetical protein